MNGEKEGERSMMSQMIEKMMDQFLSSMSPQEKKKLMKQLMPGMMEKMMEGLTAEDRQELMASMMPIMMSQMFGEEDDMSSMMMQLMQNMMQGEATGSSSKPVAETRRGFKPWEFCPCRELCSRRFRENLSKAES